MSVYGFAKSFQAVPSFANLDEPSHCLRSTKCIKKLCTLQGMLAQNPSVQGPLVSNTTCMELPSSIYLEHNYSIFKSQLKSFPFLKAFSQKTAPHPPPTPNTHPHSPQPKTSADHVQLSLFIYLLPVNSMRSSKDEVMSS